MNFHKTFVASLLSLSLLLAPLHNVAVGKGATQKLMEQKFLSRGEVVSQVVQAFDLAKKNEAFLTSCQAHADECFFVFMAMSRFDDISFKPLILYPDVSIAYRYYDDINVATMLGIIHGYIDEKNSPLYPRAGMSRIEALKVILTASKLLHWKERFELVHEPGGESALKNHKTLFKDVQGNEKDNWWYPRYVNAASSLEIIPEGGDFRPDEIITAAEFDEMLQRALSITS